jgi:hypothetical protein
LSITGAYTPRTSRRPHRSKKHSSHRHKHHHHHKHNNHTNVEEAVAERHIRSSGPSAAVATAAAVNDSELYQIRSELVAQKRRGDELEKEVERLRISVRDEESRTLHVEAKLLAERESAKAKESALNTNATSQALTIAQQVSDVTGMLF